MTTLVTGAGLIGSQIARLLVEKGERPVLLDVAPQLNALADIAEVERLTVAQGDILTPLDLARAVREHGITRILHTAANPLLTVGAQQNPHAAIRVNILGTVNVLEVARAYGLGRVVLTSSAVLSHYLTGGEDGGDAAKEEAFPRPSTFYAATKQAVESLALNYARWFGVDVAVVRFAAVVGPWRGRGGGGPSNMFRDLIERSLRGEETPLPRRAMEWVYSKDAAAGAVLALQALRLESRVFNVSTGRVYRAEEVAETVRRVIPTARVRLEEVTEASSPFPEVHAPLDLSRSRAQLGYEPGYDLERAVRDYVEWYRGLR
jgi:nucleoside-diphosphate-sugar epimerase